MVGTGASEPLGADLSESCCLRQGVAATLDSGGFNRHTFMCGQSGSGKTYSLGLVLERLLAGTSLRMVILDPNSDYIRLSEVRDGADPAVAAEYAAAASGVSVWQNDPGAAHPLQLQFLDVDPAAQAAVFGLDPIRDREEYAALAGVLAAAEKGRAVISGPDALLSSENPDTRQLGLRAANLGVFNWSVWSHGRGRSLVDELLDPTSRCLVVDLGSLDTINEQRLISETVLSTLWRNRSRRQPCLIVIDEAHNVCPRQPADAVTALATNYASLIAAEGRKFGLYLLTSTQRPQKVHDEVLSQCDNLLLMRMNSEADLGHLSDAFSFVPDGLIQRPRLSAKARAWWLASSSAPCVRAVWSATVAGRAAPTYQPHGLPCGDPAQASRKVTFSRLARSSRLIP